MKPYQIRFLQALAVVLLFVTAAAAVRGTPLHAGARNLLQDDDVYSKPASDCVVTDLVEAVCEDPTPITACCTGIETTDMCVGTTNSPAACTAEEQLGCCPMEM